MIVVKPFPPERTGAVFTSIDRLVVAAAIAVVVPFVVVLTLTRVSVPTVVEKPPT